MTPEEQRLRAIEIETEMRRRRAAAGQQGLVHTSAGPAIPAEVLPQGYTDAPLTVGQAFDVGRARGNPEEVRAYLGGEVEEGPDKRLYWRPGGSREWRAVNPLGPDWKDPVRMLGESVGPTLGSAILGLTARTPLGIVTRAALGGGLGSLGQEGIQSLEGAQRQSMGDVLRGAAVDAALEGGAAGLGTAMGALTPGGGLHAPGQEAARTLQSAVAFQQAHPQFPAPLVADILTETGKGPLPGPMIGGATRQVEGMTGAFGSLRGDMQAQAAQAVEDTFLLPPSARADTNQALAEAARRGYSSMLDRELPGSATRGVGDYRARVGLRAAGEEARQRVSAQYEGPLREALEEEKPIFRLGDAKRRWRAPTLDRTHVSEVLGHDGLPALDVLVEKVETIPEAAGKIGYLKALLSSLDDRQTSFEAIKRIRTVVGDMVQDPAFRDFKSNPARRLYGELSEVLRNPVNAKQTPRYLREFEHANLLTEWKQRMLDDRAVRRAMQADGSGILAREAASDPEAMFTPEFRQLLDLAPERDREMFLGAVRASLLDTRDPASVLEKIDRGMRLNPEAYSHLVGGEKGLADLRGRAEAISRFWSSPVGKMYDQRSRGYETTKVAVAEVKDRVGARQLTSALTGPGEMEALQGAIIDETVGSVMSPGRKGPMVVRDQALKGKIHELKQRGLWEVLSPEQQTRVTGLADYYQVVLSKSGDAGSSLENASVVADLKNVWHVWDPSSVVRGTRAIGSLGTNRVLASYLTNPKRANRLLARLNKAPRDLRPWAAASIFAMPVVELETEEGFVDPAMALVTQWGDQPQRP